MAADILPEPDFNLIRIVFQFWAPFVPFCLLFRKSSDNMFFFQFSKDLGYFQQRKFQIGF